MLVLNKDIHLSMISVNMEINKPEFKMKLKKIGVNVKQEIKKYKIPTQINLKHLKNVFKMIFGIIKELKCVVDNTISDVVVFTTIVIPKIYLLKEFNGVKHISHLKMLLHKLVYLILAIGLYNNIGNVVPNMEKAVPLL